MKIKNPMVNVLILLVVTLSVPLGAALADETGVAALGPCINDQTVALVRLDVTRLDVSALTDKIEALLREFGGEAVVKQSASDLEGFRMNVGKAVLDLRKAGGQELYAVFNMLDLPHFVMAVPISEGADAAAIEAWVQENKKAFNVGKLKVHRLDSVVLVGLASSVDLLLAMPAQDASVWQQSLQSCGESTLQVVLAPDADQRRVLVEMMPSFRFPEREKLMAFLSQGLTWIGVGVQEPPQMAAQLTVQAVDETQAQSLYAWVQTILTCVVQEPDFQQVPQLREHMQAMAPQQQGSRLSMHMNAAQADWVITQLVGPALVRARSQALRITCGTNLSGIGKALLIYSNDHQDKFPADLNILIEACEMPSKGLVCPVVGEEGSYVYRGKDLNVSHELYMVMVHDRKANHADHGRRNVLFLDSHVEWMTEAEFQQAIAKDNEYRRKNGLKVLPAE